MTAGRRRAITFEDSLGRIANRLNTLHKRIEGASIEEKRKTVNELDKDISVVSENAKGKYKPVVNMTFRFNDSVQNPPVSIPILYCTPGRAAITEQLQQFQNK